MESGASNGFVHARSRVIERPRLVRLLNEAESSVLLLVGPAGYGKSTLAEQWLSTKRHVFYRSTTAAGDVAALVAGLAKACVALTATDPTPVLQRVAVASDPEAEVDEVIRLIETLFSTWPADAWLAIDDYQHLVGSPAAEAVVERLALHSNVNTLITSRTRPTWATPRRLLYGDIFEIGTHSLTMNIDEATAVLGSRRSASGLVALTNGWPAVIGLAAIARTYDVRDPRLERDLYDFFADELFAGVTRERQRDLCAVAVPPRLTRNLAHNLLGEPRAAATVETACEMGLIADPAAPEWHLHPLLRQFLLSKFPGLPIDEQGEVVERTVALLRADRQWDDAFVVIETLDRPELVSDLLSDALLEMLRTGRIATLRRWQEVALRLDPPPPVTAVVDAEISFRQGRHAEAEALAEEALALLSQNDPLRPMVLFRAGQAAYFRGHEKQALDRLDEAVATTKGDPTLEKEARWAAFIAALDLDASQAGHYLRAFEDVRDPTIDDSVRLANARLLTSIRCGGIRRALDAVSSTATIAKRARDPMVKTGFWNVFGCALALNARYEAALAAARQERSEAEKAGLSFVLAHADLLEALAFVGLRRPDEATALIADVAAVARERDDGFLLVTAELVRARLLVLAGDLTRLNPPDEQLKATSRLSYAEYLGIVAIARAASGNAAGSATARTAAAEYADHAEARSLIALAEAIGDVWSGKDGIESTRRAVSLAAELGHRDSVVIAYRAFPPLVSAAVRAGHEDLVTELLRASNDHSLGRAYGLFEREGPRGTLSPRECQVLDLAAKGRTNAEIASALFISSVTVKAHLRHVYEKLGVRNRVEAAAIFKDEDQQLPAHRA